MHLIYINRFDKKASYIFTPNELLRAVLATDLYRFCVFFLEFRVFFLELSCKFCVFFLELSSYRKTQCSVPRDKWGTLIIPSITKSKNHNKACRKWLRIAQFQSLNTSPCSNRQAQKLFTHFLESTHFLGAYSSVK